MTSAGWWFWRSRSPVLPANSLWAGCRDGGRTAGTEETGPVEPAALAEFAEPVEPMEPEELEEPLELVEPMEPVEPAGPVEPVEPVEAAEPAEPGAAGAGGAAGRDGAGAPELLAEVPAGGNWKAGGISAGMGAGGYWNGPVIPGAGETAGWGALISEDQSLRGWDI